MRQVKIKNFVIGQDAPLVMVAGPCVIESQELTLRIARELKNQAQERNIPFIFKASFDKANRSSISSYRGPGLEKGLAILKKVKEKFDVPVLTDVHCISQIDAVAKVVDVMQIPAFLCRQTDFVCKAASKGKVVNIKKGQFLAPWDVKNIIKKCLDTGNENIIITERGVCFGYNNLVSDMRSLPIIREMGVPVIFDATHSVQLPGGQGACSGGQREFVPHLARSAVAAGCDGVFFECHPEPDKALCDGANSLQIDNVFPLMEQLIAIDKIVKKKLNYYE
ncbi:3-deoxy-8-phosphooctulonate synthase [bacterium]|nr:3-deoxy-8-phosphooctulonate synthase [bacterium]